MRGAAITAITAAGALVLAAGSVAAASVLAPGDAPPRVVTHTQVVYRTRTVVRVVTRWKTRTVTDTVTQDVSVPDPGAVACIDALYGDLSFDASQGHVLPNGWWDVRCEAYAP